MQLLEIRGRGGSPLRDNVFEQRQLGKKRYSLNRVQPRSVALVRRLVLCCLPMFAHGAYPIGQVTVLSYQSTSITDRPEILGRVKAKGPG